ncbi:TPA: type I toxin-antitoxin system Ibs family toxin [Escherichia fergusonii]|nr:type I toxin-antitoxin system Ibs family toxin [Escherichia fergusonii]
MKLVIILIVLLLISFHAY